MSDTDFRKMVGEKIKGTNASLFLSKCHYVSGAYDCLKDLQSLSTACEQLESEKSKKGANRIFYLAIPPSIFESAAASIKLGAMTTNGWNRIIVEKPFGKDLNSAAQLENAISQYFSEDQIYRIDHYLGKEMVINLMVLRFANSMFEPIWNRNYISSVQITFKETDGVEGRGSYFDEYGIIRDVMQNHLLQILSLIAMETPVSLEAEDIRNEKVKILRCITPLTRKNLLIGQYISDAKGKVIAYKDDQKGGVKKDSLTPTYALATVYIKNPRWAGVPFILKCGKGLDQRKAEMRIQFRKYPTDLFPKLNQDAINELVLRVQPNEAIYWKINTKAPGLSDSIGQSELDLTYRSRFNIETLPDAYERLLLDVMRGDHNLFVRNDELIAAWKVFTPILHELEKLKVKPTLYPFGTRGPEGEVKFLTDLGVIRTASYHWVNPCDHLLSIMSPPPLLSTVSSPTSILNSSSSSSQSSSSLSSASSSSSSSSSSSTHVFLSTSPLPLSSSAISNS
eukprot:TRINITY_DN481_c0_g1_i1.p1 TRINITY_DN481_c0_g1~~TRINITY_DN481_c0_g1_i1.p1  ORF type:complete len:509 (+),score=140.72 TRINITY_DN481_c0_g1_i1:602-2128(+)